ncbi:MAG: BPL-N domain-containing protein [Acidobacteriota bacterium]
MKRAYAPCRGAAESPIARRAFALLSFVAILAITACRPQTSRSSPPILLFNGAGASPNDVSALESVLKRGQLDYSTVDSRQLNDMSESRLMSYRLLIVPGGDFIAISKGLTPTTTAKIHDAVQNGLNYLGICAGGFFAGHFAPNSLNLASGVQFQFYSDERRGIRKSAVAISSVDKPSLEHYWEDGPQFTGWGAVVGKYPDGTPAVVEGASGKGWVVLCGVHPEAPESWRRGMTFTTSASDSNAFALTLVDAALHRKELPHY